MFIHYNPHRPGKLSHKVSRGFTAYITTSETGFQVPEGKCAVRITHCNAKDEFNKKLGRSYAQGAVVVEVVPIRQLPKFLSQHAEKCAYWGTEYDFMYVLKNFV